MTESERADNFHAKHDSFQRLLVQYVIHFIQNILLCQCVPWPQWPVFVKYNQSLARSGPLALIDIVLEPASEASEPTGAAPQHSLGGWGRLARVSSSAAVAAGHN